jgi:hypothetical protein
MAAAALDIASDCNVTSGCRREGPGRTAVGVHTDHLRRGRLH